jgi:hypothetical protein
MEFSVLSAAAAAIRELVPLGHADTRISHTCNISLGARKLTGTTLRLGELQNSHFSGKILTHSLASGSLGGPSAPTIGNAHMETNLLTQAPISVLSSLADTKLQDIPRPRPPAPETSR